ncbi:MAG: hypothetical protein ACLP5H_23630 [Desulfomonilaceae bacterium]
MIKPEDVKLTEKHFLTKDDLLVLSEIPAGRKAVALLATAIEAEKAAANAFHIVLDGLEWLAEECDIPVEKMNVIEEKICVAYAEAQASVKPICGC